MIVLEQLYPEDGIPRELEAPNDCFVELPLPPPHEGTIRGWRVNGQIYLDTAWRVKVTAPIDVTQECKLRVTKSDKFCCLWLTHDGKSVTHDANHYRFELTPGGWRVLYYPGGLLEAYN